MFACVRVTKIFLGRVSVSWGARKEGGEARGDRRKKKSEWKVNKVKA